VSPSKLRRRRGVMLTNRGLSRVHDAQRRLAAANDDTRISLEALSAGVGLSTRTLSRLMNRESPVDLRTLETIFFALRLVLDETDYEYAVADARERWPMYELPQRLTTLLGRDELLERLEALVATSRLLTLTGTGGIGKTRLAIELALRRDATLDVRTWFVDLAIVKDPRESISSVTAAFGVAPEAPRVLSAIGEQLAERAGTLVLDNCENVARILGPFLVDLLHACPTLRIIATSREQFSVESERVFRVPPLAVPESRTGLTVTTLMQYSAMALFVERANAQNQSFALDEAIAPVICEVVQRLDGLPLAIELAAARVGVMSPADLLEYLRARFIGLTSDGIERDPRHRSMRALMDWSFERLTDEERFVSRRASVFTGSFDASALEAVCSDEISATAASDVAFRLVRKSLLEMDAHVDRTRYLYLAPVREYAWVQLEGARESTVSCWLHALYYLGRIQDMIGSFSANDQAQALRALEREFGNVRAALQWSFTAHNEHVGAVMVSELPEYWDARGQYRDGEVWIRRALAIDAELLAQATSAKLFEGLSLLLFRQTRLEEASRAAASSLAAFEAVADEFGVCRARNLLGIIALDAGDPEIARRQFWINLEQGERLRNPRIRIVALNNLGRVEGQVDCAKASALRRFQQSLELASSIGLHTMVAMALRNVAEAHADLGDVLLAIAFSERGMQVARDLKNDALYCIQALQTAIYRLRISGYENATSELTVALDAIARDPYQTELSDQLDSIAELLIDMEESARAVILLTATATRRGASGAAGGTSHVRHALLLQRARQRLEARKYDDIRASAVAFSIEAAFRAALLTPKAAVGNVSP